ncbi:MAG: hypothetical protein Q4G26_16570 [Paracoccus sp. (in: a-proteobacteria)]|nr:hypothetical protein [Paracoccus sp. (in: a-proteobacteria)]
MNWIGAVILVLAVLTMVLADILQAAPVDMTMGPDDLARQFGGATGLVVAPSDQG